MHGTVLLSLLLMLLIFFLILIFIVIFLCHTWVDGLSRTVFQTVRTVWKTVLLKPCVTEHYEPIQLKGPDLPDSSFG